MSEEALVLPITGDPAQMATLVAGVEKIVAALDHMGKKGEEVSKKQEASWLSTVASAKKAGEAYVYIKGALTDVVGTAVAAVERFGELAAQGERDVTALERLGGAWEEVERGTRGTLTATQAYAAQQTLVRSGLRLSADELALVTRYAREHGDVMASTSERVQRFTEALREGESGGLRQFGIAVQQGATRAQTFERALRQMRAATVEAEPAQRTLAEETQRFSDSLTEGASATANLVSHLIDLPGILSEVNAGLRDVTRDMRDLVQLENDLPQQRQRNEAMNAAQQRHVAALRAARGSLSAAGLAGQALPADISGLNAEQIDRVSGSLEALARRLPNTQLSAEDLARRQGDQGPMRLDTSFQALEDIARERQGAGAAYTAARRNAPSSLAAITAEIARMRAENAAHQAPQGPRDSAGGAAASGPDWRGQKLLDAMAYERRRTDEFIALEEQKATEAAAYERQRQQEYFDFRREKAEEQAAYERTHSQAARRDQMAQGRVDAGSQRSAELADLRDPRSQGERLGALAGDAELRREQQQLEQRYELQRTFTDRWQELHHEQVDSTRLAAEGISAAYTSMGDALSSHVQALVAGRETAGQAAQGFLSDTLMAISKEAATKGGFYFAEGLADLSNPITMPLAPGAFAASAAFFAVAAGTGLAGAAAAPSAPSGASASPTATHTGSGTSGGSGGGGTQITETHIYYAPVVGGRESTNAETGDYLHRYDRASDSRLVRTR